MLGLHVRLGGERTSRFSVPHSRTRYTIGSHDDNDLVLRDGDVQPFHCVLTRSLHRWSIQPFDGRIDGSPIAQPAELHDDARIELGGYTVVVSYRHTTYEPVERDLLDAIAAGDGASRMVYADWLEARGDLDAAEFLRLQDALAGADVTDSAARDRFQREVRRLRQLAEGFEFEWRQLVGRPDVEGCRQLVFEFQCTRDWGTLETTDDPNIRRCATCNDNVYYADTVDAARTHAQRGRCVVVDLVQFRRPGDLESPSGPRPAGMIVR